jgi:hypothetical protein
MGRGMVRRLSRELERSSSAPGMAREAGLSITGDGKWQTAERKSEGAVVVVTGRTTQPLSSEGPLLHRCGCWEEEPPVSAYG